MAKGNTQNKQVKAEEIPATTPEVIVTGTETQSEAAKVEDEFLEAGPDPKAVKPADSVAPVRPIKTVQGILGYAVDPTVLADHIPQDAGIDLGVEPIIMGTPIESGISVETLIQLVAQVEVTFGRQFKRDDKPRLYFS